jgi:hypothetical protein
MNKTAPTIALIGSIIMFMASYHYHARGGCSSSCIALMNVCVILSSYWFYTVVLRPTMRGDTVKVTISYFFLTLIFLSTVSLILTLFL